MKFIYTPEEALSIAQILFDFLKSQSFTVSIDQALNDEAPCSTTLIAKKAELSILVEAQNQANCDQYLKDLALWLNNHRFYAELFIATHRDASFSGSFFKQLDQTGIGLILVEDSGSVKIERQPRNPALVVCPEPTLKFGPFESKVKECIAKFNLPHSFLTSGSPRFDAARDMCEIVEGLTEELAITGVRKKILKLKEKNIEDQDWYGQINTLASKKACLPGKSPIIDGNFKADLHSFRGMRNLLDHRARSKRKEVERQQQLAERMMMGPRLIAVLVAKK